MTIILAPPPAMLSNRPGVLKAPPPHVFFRGEIGTP